MRISAALLIILGHIARQSLAHDGRADSSSSSASGRAMDENDNELAAGLKRRELLSSTGTDPASTDAPASTSTEFSLLSELATETDTLSPGGGLFAAAAVVVPTATTTTTTTLLSYKPLPTVFVLNPGPNQGFNNNNNNMSSTLPPPPQRPAFTPTPRYTPAFTPGRTLRVPAETRTITAPAGTVGADLVTAIPRPVLRPQSLFVAEGSVIAPSAKVFGVGWGLFVALFLGVTLVVVCIAVSRNDNAGVIYLACVVIMAIVIMSLRFTPKVPVGTIVPPQSEVDMTYIPRIAFVILLTATSLGGVALIGVFYVLYPVYAIKPEDN